MPLVASVDYVARRIYLSAETVDVPLDTLAVYKEVRARRVVNEADRRFRPLITAGGNEQKITGLTYTPVFVRLDSFVRIVPFNSAQRLRLVRDTFAGDGVAGRDCFDRSSLTFPVDIDVDFPEIEVRVVNTSGAAGGLTTGQAAQLAALAALLPEVKNDTGLIPALL